MYVVPVSKIVNVTISNALELNVGVTALYQLIVLADPAICIAVTLLAVPPCSKYNVTLVIKPDTVPRFVKFGVKLADIDV